MGLLEKLRPQPRWKHGDPAVRAAAVYDIGPEEHDALVSLAREDADPRVRRAAVSRLSDPGVLGDVARTDPDEEVRAEAIRNLAALAVEAEDAPAAVPVLRQLSELGRAKEVTGAARSAASPAVRAAAVDLLADARALGSVSRHALDAATRLRALERLTDAEEVAAKNAGFTYALLSLWPINKQNSPKTEAEKAGLQFVAENKGATNYYTEETLGGKKYFTAVYADVAVSKACVMCHNGHTDTPKDDFELNDVMGGVVLRIPIN